jgi:hypothetical protein
LRLLHQFGQIGSRLPEKKGVIATPHNPVHVKMIWLVTQFAHRRRAEGTCDDPNQRGDAYRDQCRSED